MFLSLFPIVASHVDWVAIAAVGLSSPAEPSNASNYVHRYPLRGLFLGPVRSTRLIAVRAQVINLTWKSEQAGLWNRTWDAAADLSMDLPGEGLHRIPPSATIQRRTSTPIAKGRVQAEWICKVTFIRTRRAIPTCVSCFCQYGSVLNPGRASSLHLNRTSIASEFCLQFSFRYLPYLSSHSLTL